MQKNMKLSTKLIINTSIPLIALAGFAVFLHFQMTQMEFLSRVEGQDSFEMATVAEEMQLDVVQVQQFLSDISATRAKDGFDDGFKKAAEFNALFLAGLVKCKQHYANEHSQSTVADAAHQIRAPHPRQAAVSDARAVRCYILPQRDDLFRQPCARAVAGRMLALAPAQRLFGRGPCGKSVGAAQPVQKRGRLHLYQTLIPMMAIAWVEKQSDENGAPESAMDAWSYHGV